MSRNDFTVFPILDELLEIIAKEQQRPLPKGKENIHYPDFTLISRLSHSLNMDASFFATDYDYNDL